MATGLDYFNRLPVGQAGSGTDPRMATALDYVNRPTPPAPVDDNAQLYPASVGGGTKGPPASYGSAYVAGSGQPGSTVTNPDGSISYDPGAGRGPAPLFGGAAGRYTSFTNRLPVGQAGSGTDPLLIAAIQRSMGPGANPFVQSGAADAGAMRGVQLGGLGNLATAGAGNAAAQRAIMAGVGGAAAQGHGMQTGLAGKALTAGAPFAGMQGGLANLLAQGAIGQGPSAAQAQLQSGLEQNIAAQHSLAAGVRGAGAAGAMRGATQQGNQLALQTQDQAAMLRAQEQQAAQQALGGVLAQGRQGDIQNVGTAADIVNGMRGQDTNAGYAMGGIAGTARAQDIGQAGAFMDAAGNVRGQDISGALGLGGLQNQTTGLGIQSGLGLNADRLKGLGIDVQALLGGGQLMAGQDESGRQDALAKEASLRNFGLSLGTGVAGAATGLAGGIANLNAGLGFNA